MTTQAEQTLTEALASIGISHARDAHSENDGRRTWRSAATGYVIGRFDATEGWDFVNIVQGAASAESCQ